MIPDPARLLLVDGHSMAFRAFFALPAEKFTDAGGQATNAVYGFTSMLFNVMKSERPTHIAIAFDLPGGTFRTAEYDEYKAGRAATPPEFDGQIELIQDVLDALGIRWVTYPQYEADDIIATLATEHGGDLEVLVTTSDRDSIQLITDNVTLLQPRKGVTDLVRMTPEAVAEKYGVDPASYPDLAALVGESADNLPGVPGVGPKTAAKWIAAYGGLDGVIAHAGELPGKAGQALRDHVDGVLRNRRLNAAVTDLEIPLDLDEYALGRGSRAELHEVFDRLRFNAIRTRVPEEFLGEDVHAREIAAAQENPGRDPETVRDLTASGLAELLAGSAAEGAALAVEGSWERGHGSAEAIAFAAGDDLAVVDLAGLSPADEQALAGWLADARIPKALHESKLAWHALCDRGLPIEGVAFDIGIAEFLCRPDQRPATLASLALTHLGEELPDDEPGEQQELDLTADLAQRRRIALARRADVVDRLQTLLRAELEERHATRLLADLEMPLLPVLAAMEHAGIAVDDETLAELDRGHAAVQQEVAEAAFAEIGGDRINLGSPKQLQEVLFDRLGMPKTRRTKTGYSTDAESLLDLVTKSPHPFLQRVLEHRDVTKMRQIIETLRRSIADDGRIHTTFHQNIAATGRLSSNNPNLQNIPVRTAEGRRVREAFTVTAPYEALVTADYSQIEMRIMAHLSRDEGLIEAFRSGEDLHVFVASRVFDVEPAEVDAEMRSKTKAVSYGLAYGLSAFGLARQLHISSEEANRLRDGYFERFGGVRDYLRSSVEIARERGYTETILGRRRYLPDLLADQRQRRENAERIALNAPIQGSAADIMKLAMLRVDRELQRRELGSRSLLQVHDELVLEVAAGEEDEVRDVLIDGMGGAYELSVPLEVSVGTGPNWFAAAH